MGVCFPMASKAGSFLFSAFSTRVSFPLPHFPQDCLYSNPSRPSSTFCLFPPCSAPRSGEQALFITSSFFLGRPPKMFVHRDAIPTKTILSGARLSLPEELNQGASSYCWHQGWNSCPYQCNIEFPRAVDFFIKQRNFLNFFLTLNDTSFSILGIDPCESFRKRTSPFFWNFVYRPEDCPSSVPP